MSRDDSQLQIKSLEQILQLGHTIALQEAKKHTTSPTNMTAAVATNTSRKTTPKKTPRIPSPVAPHHVHAPAMHSSVRRAALADGGVSRLVKVPGLTPVPTSGKTNKVFGHKL